MSVFTTKSGKNFSFLMLSWKMGGVLPRMPRELGNKSAEFFRRSWLREGWLDRTLDKWKKRKHDNPKNRGRKILSQSGELRASIRIMSADRHSVVIGSNLPYAAIHNYGESGTATVRSHTRRTPSGGTTTVRSHTRAFGMPQRQFMGDSEALDQIIGKQITDMIDSVFRID